MVSPISAITHYVLAIISLSEIMIFSLREGKNTSICH
jgi:hypothetical protein